MPHTTSNPSLEGFLIYLATDPVGKVALVSLLVYAVYSGIMSLIDNVNEIIGSCADAKDSS